MPALRWAIVALWATCLLNILRMDGQNLIKFCIHYIIDKIYVCIEKGHFLQICNRVSALDLSLSSDSAMEGL